ncbi:MAG: sigma-70 family RNA polymerase sigma factor [Christensenellales bacterium]
MNDSVARVQELWKKYAQDKTLETKNELVLSYVYLVKSIVFRMLPTYGGYSNYDDFVSAGVIGLIDAVEKFDIKRDVKFEYYASMRIRGEIIDHIRKQDWAPSSLRRKIQEITNAYGELEKTFLREATDSEVAQYLNMETEELQKIMEKTHMFNVIHFEEMLSEDYSVGQTIPDEGESPEEQVEKDEVKKILGDLIDSLPEKEKLVVTLYYYEEITLKGIANILGVSESRISQIHSKVILKLKTKLQHVLDQ